MMLTSNVAWPGRYRLPGRPICRDARPTKKKTKRQRLRPNQTRVHRSIALSILHRRTWSNIAPPSGNIFEGVASDIFVNPTARYWSQPVRCAYVQTIGVRVRRLVVSWLLPSCASMSSVLLGRPGTSLRVQNVSRNGSHGSTTDPVDPVGEGMVIVNCPCGPQSPGAGP